MGDEQARVKIITRARNYAVIIPASKLLLRVLGTAVAGLAIIVAALAWRLSEGPLSLGFLTPYFGEALSSSEAGISAEIDDTILAWGGWDRTLDIRAVNVRLRRKDGSLIAAVPQVAVALSVRGLLRGMFAPTSLDIVGISAKLIRRPDGRFDFGPSAGGEPATGNLIAVLVDELAKPRDKGVFGYLTRVSILDADLAFDDRLFDVTWRAPHASLILWRESEGVRGDLRVSLELGNRVAKFVASGRYDPSKQILGLTVSFDQIEPATLADRAPAFAKLRAIQLPLSGSITVNVASDGRFSAINFDLRGAAGQIDVPELRPDPFAVRELTVRGQVADDLASVKIEEANLDLIDLSVALGGKVSFGGPGIGLDLQVSVPRLATNALPRYWPADLGRNARDWVLGHIRDGTLSDIRARLAVPPGAIESGELPADSVLVEFKMDGLKVAYFRPLPEMTDAAGVARLTHQRLDLKLAAAQVGDLKVSEGTVVVTDLDHKDQDATINFVVQGPAQSALALIDHKPLGFAKSVGVNPAQVRGLAAIRARFVFPLRKDLTVDKLQVVAAANLRDIAIPNIFEHYQLSNGDLSLKVDRERMEVGGGVVLNGVPAQVTWHEEFAAKGGFGSHYSITGTTDDAGREALGFATGPYITGTLPASVIIDTRRGGEARIQARFNLQPAAMRIDALQWGKKPGQPGEMSLTASLPPQGPTRISNLVLTAADLALSGQAEIAGGKLTHAEFDRVTVGQSDFTAAVRRDPDGGFAVDVRGPRFDFRPYLDDMLQSKAPNAEKSPPLRLTASFGQLILTDDRWLTGFAATAARLDDQWSTVDASGTLGADAPMRLTIRPAGKRRQLLLTSNDAGAVLKAIGVSDNTVGGVIKLQAEMQDDLPEAPIKGTIQMDKFKVVKAPLMARILTVASLSGITALLSGEGISFVRAEVPFVWIGSSIKIEQARAWGSEIGFTADGTLDRASDTANLNGTIVPAYTINTVLGSIPLIGKLLVSKEGEGIFGITYKISGPLGDPVVSVNPLSALAPGILRRMFQPSEEKDKDAGTETIPAPPISSLPKKAN